MLVMLFEQDGNDLAHIVSLAPKRCPQCGLNDTTFAWERLDDGTLGERANYRELAHRGQRVFIELTCGGGHTVGYCLAEVVTESEGRRRAATYQPLDPDDVADALLEVAGHAAAPDLARTIMLSLPRDYLAPVLEQFRNRWRNILPSYRAEREKVDRLLSLLQQEFM